MKFWVLLLIIFAQIAILAGEYGNAVYPLWTGQEIKLKTIPIDPRSLFRGNYAQLAYDISTVKSPEFAKKVRNGEVVYVQLEADEQGIYQFKQLHLEPPESGIYIRGRLQQRYRSKENYHILYGIEAYFAPKDKALALERDLRDGGIAQVMLSQNGKATLKGVIPAEVKPSSERGNRE